MAMSFRYKLSNAINNIRTWNDRMLSDMELLDQVIAVIKLSRTFGLSISLIRPARRDDPASHNYNCFMWAFGLLEREWLNRLVPGGEDVYPRSDFTDHLVRHYLSEISQQEIRPGDIAIYFKDGRPVHAGTWDSGHVVSKWGLYSHLWKHGPCELPIEYGEELRIYRRLPEKTFRYAFEHWCRHLLPAGIPARNRIDRSIIPLTCSKKAHDSFRWVG